MSRQEVDCWGQHGGGLANRTDRALQALQLIFRAHDLQPYLCMHNDLRLLAKQQRDCGWTYNWLVTEVTAGWQRVIGSELDPEEKTGHDTEEQTRHKTHSWIPTSLERRGQQRRQIGYMVKAAPMLR